MSKNSNLNFKLDYKNNKLITILKPTAGELLLSYLIFVVENTSQFSKPMIALPPKGKL